MYADYDTKAWANQENICRNGKAVVESEAKNDEDHRGEIMIIFAGYTKKMEDS